EVRQGPVGQRPDRIDQGPWLTRRVRVASVVTLDEVREFATRLPRTTEALVYGRVKFRIGRIVYAGFSRKEGIMGFGFPRELREMLVASDPEKFFLPRPSDMRFNWVCVRLDAIDSDEMKELVLDAWRMVVPKKVAADYEASAIGLPKPV